MSILRRVLYFDALLSAITAIALVAVPHYVISTLFGQPLYPDYGIPRLLGVCLFTLALLMVLVAQRIEDLWWWSWAFVILEFGGAAVGTMHAALGVPTGAPAWPWWLLAAGSWILCFALVWGLAVAGAGRSPS